MQPDYVDYSFLNESGQPPKANASGGSNKTRRILVVVIGAAVLVTGFMSVFSFVLNSGPDLKLQRLKIAQQHVELIRVAELGIGKARGPQAKNLASTTKLTFKSSRTDIVGIAEKDQKVSEKMLSEGKSTKTDERLTEAEQTNRFDEVFLQVVNELLTTYRKDLEATFNATSSKKDKEILVDVFNQVSALLQESGTTANSGS